MLVKFSKKFVKQFGKSPEVVKAVFNDRLQIFLLDKFDLILNNHGLSGKMKDMRSINLGGDWRALFQELQNGDVIFKAIGTHSQLYK